MRSRSADSSDKREKRKGARRHVRGDRDIGLLVSDRFGHGGQEVR